MYRLLYADQSNSSLHSLGIRSPSLLTVARKLRFVGDLLQDGRPDAPRSVILLNLSVQPFIYEQGNTRFRDVRA